MNNKLKCRAFITRINNKSIDLIPLFIITIQEINGTTFNNY